MIHNPSLKKTVDNLLKYRLDMSSVEDTFAGECEVFYNVDDDFYDKQPVKTKHTLKEVMSIVDDSIVVDKLLQAMTLKCKRIMAETLQLSINLAIDDRIIAQEEEALRAKNQTALSVAKAKIKKAGLTKAEFKALGLKP